MVLLALPDGSPKIGHGDLWEWQGPEPVSATEVLKYMASQPPVEPRPDPKLVMSKSTLDLLDVAATANRRGSASMPDLLLLPTLFPANQSSRHVPENARRSRGPRPLHRLSGVGAIDERLQKLQKQAARRTANAEAYGNNKLSRWRELRVLERLEHASAAIAHEETRQAQLKSQLTRAEAQAASSAVERVRASRFGNGASSLGLNSSSSSSVATASDHPVGSSSSSSELARLRSWPANRAVRDKLLAQPPIPITHSPGISPRGPSVNILPSPRMNFAPFVISEATARQLEQVEREAQARARRLEQLEKAVKRSAKLERERAQMQQDANALSRGAVGPTAASSSSLHEVAAPAAADGVIPPPPEPEEKDDWMREARSSVEREISRMIASKVTRSPGRRRRVHAR